MGNKPNLSRFWVFGCKAYTHVPETKRHKLQVKIFECVHLGFTKNRHTCVLLHQPTGHIIESRNVTFDEGLTVTPSQVEIIIESASCNIPPAQTPSAKST